MYGFASVLKKVFLFSGIAHDLQFYAAETVILQLIFDDVIKALKELLSFFFDHGAFRELLSF